MYGNDGVLIIDYGWLQNGQKDSELLLSILIIEFVLQELNLLDQVQHGMRSVLGLDVVIPEHGIGGRYEMIFISDNQLSDHG